MKTLIFSHLSDIDGMGGVVLAKLAFGDVDYILCETFNLLDKIRELIANKTIYQYDQIFITDMWLEDPSIVVNNVKLRDITIELAYTSNEQTTVFGKYMPSCIAFRLYDDDNISNDKVFSIISFDNVVTIDFQKSLPQLPERSPRKQESDNSNDDSYSDDSYESD